MKKGGIIAAIIIIVILSLVVFGIEVFKNGLPKLEFSDINHFNINSSYSNESNTYITADFTVKNTALERLVEVNISYNKTQCNIFYYNQSIGRILFNETEFNISKIPKNITSSPERPVTAKSESNVLNISASKRKIISIIKGSEKQTIYVLFILSNRNLSQALYNHTMNHYEKGKIRFNISFSINEIDLNLTFSINQLKIPLKIPIPFNQDRSFDVEKEFITDILEKIEWIKYNMSIDEQRISPYPVLNTTKLSIYKKIESNIINVNRTKRFSNFSNITNIIILKKFLEKQKPIFDVYLGDQTYWIYNSKPYSIHIGQELVIHGVPWRLKLLNIFLPVEFDFKVNNKTTIGHGKISIVGRDYRFPTTKRLELNATINCSNLSTLLFDHIKNENFTRINITNITIQSKFFKGGNEHVTFFGKIYEKFKKQILFMINKPIAEIDKEVFNSNKNCSNISKFIPAIKLNQITIDFSPIRDILSLLQMFAMTMIINTHIVVIILRFAFWKKGKYLIFQKKK